MHSHSKPKQQVHQQQARRLARTLGSALPTCEIRLENHEQLSLSSQPIAHCTASAAAPATATPTATPTATVTRFYCPCCKLVSSSPTLVEFRTHSSWSARWRPVQPQKCMRTLSANHSGLTPTRVAVQCSPQSSVRHRLDDLSLGFDWCASVSNKQYTAVCGLAFASCSLRFQAMAQCECRRRRQRMDGATTSIVTRALISTPATHTSANSSFHLND